MRIFRSIFRVLLCEVGLHQKGPIDFSFGIPSRSIFCTACGAVTIPKAEWKRRLAMMKRIDELCDRINAP